MTEVKILYRNESRVVVEGVDEGAEVALVDPTRTPGSSLAAATPPAAPAAAGAPGGVR